MKLNFSKKTKTVSMESLHKINISPKKDWVFMIFVFCGTVVLATIVSTFFFYRLLHMGESSEGNTLEEETPSTNLNTQKLNSALEFINSKRVE